MTESVLEEWKPVNGFEGRYEVSSLGRVQSLERFARVRGGIRRVPHKVKKLELAGNGYLRVQLGPGYGQSRFFPVHRLVLEAFCGKPTSEDMQCNHKDGNKSNNVIENLEWMTGNENMRHAATSGLLRRGTSHPHTRLTEDNVRKIATLDETIKNLARMFGVGTTTIFNIRRGETWSHVTGIKPHSQKRSA